MFRKTFKGDSEKVQISLKEVLKGVLREFEGSFKDVFKKFQGCLKKVSRVFQENFTKSFMGVSKVSMKFFSICLTHESHRSYPSRRRACFLTDVKTESN